MRNSHLFLLRLYQVYSLLSPRGKSAIDALYNKVVTLLVLRSGLGSPTNGKVIREAAAAAHSVFPPSELTRSGFRNVLGSRKSGVRQENPYVVRPKKNNNR